MRGRVAKAIRRATRLALGADPRDARYTARIMRHNLAVGAVVWLDFGPSLQVELEPRCGRALYKRLKRRTAAVLRGQAPQ